MVTWDSLHINENSKSHKKKFVQQVYHSNAKTNIQLFNKFKAVLTHKKKISHYTFERTYDTAHLDQKTNFQ
jgi:hypothetical protein